MYTYIEVYLNGVSIYPEEFSKPANDADGLDISVVIAGG
jgi:hypothetical protein